MNPIDDQKASQEVSSTVPRIKNAMRLDKCVAALIPALYYNDVFRTLIINEIAHIVKPQPQLIALKSMFSSMKNQTECEHATIEEINKLVIGHTNDPPSDPLICLRNLLDNLYVELNNEQIPNLFGLIRRMIVKCCGTTQHLVDVDVPIDESVYFWSCEVDTPTREMRVYNLQEVFNATHPIDGSPMLVVAFDP